MTVQDSSPYAEVLAQPPYQLADRQYQKGTKAGRPLFPSRCALK